MSRANVHIAALFTALFWGASYILTKIVFETYKPLTTVFLRIVIACVVLFLIIFIAGRREKIKKEDVWLFLISAFLNPFVYFIGESYGLKYVSASVSAFIIATIPVFTPIAAYKVFGERLSATNILGLVISFAGIGMIVFNLKTGFTASPVGIAFLFLGVFSAVTYTVFLKKLSFKYSPFTIIAWQNLLGALYFLPFFLYFDLEDYLSVRPDAKTIISLVSLGVFASMFAFVLFTYVIRNIGMSRANFYNNLVPVIAAIIAYFVLKESFTPMKIVGMVVIVIGVVLSEMERKNNVDGKKKKI